VFEILPTGIDGLDALLGGGIRFPEGSAAFVFLTGETGTGKTLLGLEMLVRAWWRDDQGGRTFLFYSVEQTPKDIQKKLEYDFGGYFGAPGEIRLLDGENPHKLCLETDAPSGGRNLLVLTQANPSQTNTGIRIDIGWIQAEIGNYERIDPVAMVCIDNVGLLLTGLDYLQKRSTLLQTRHELMRNRIHGIFIQEEDAQAGGRFPSAEELSTDVLIHLSFEETNGFKARQIEILKARHQYYYRGSHHFSIAGKGVVRDQYLGARGERGPGTHIYPSVPAQLSIARDRSEFKVPPRGEKPIPFCVPSIGEAFLEGTGPTRLSSTIVLAEPGTRYTRLCLRFLAEGAKLGETSLLVSTKEDRNAVERICRRREGLAPLMTEDRTALNPSFRLLYLHPEFLSPGKFVSDILQMAQASKGERPEARASRLAFDNIYKLHGRFPLLEGEDFLVPALVDLLRYREVTSFFVDLVPRGSNPGELSIEPAFYLSSFDNVIHLFLKKVNGDYLTHARILKSIGNDFKRTSFPVDL